MSPTASDQLVLTFVRSGTKESCTFVWLHDVLMPDVIRVNCVIKCLPNDAVQALSTHHRASKCCGAAVNTKEKRQAHAPKGTSYCTLHSPRVQD